MTINFNVTGEDRKRLATCIAEVLGCKKKYLAAPTFAYQVDSINVSKDGVISFNDRADSEEIEMLIEKLAEQGFTAESLPTENEDNGKIEETPTGEDNGLESEPVGLTVSIPLIKVNLGNLTNLLDAKGKLIQKTLGISATLIEMNEDNVSFPWFDTLPTADEVDAYTRLITALCKMSKEQKRISSNATEPDNERYAFRCFLLRLGFIGDEYKAARKILLRNLEGNSAFKDGNPKVQKMIGRINNDIDFYDDVMSLQDTEVHDEIFE